MNGKLISIEGTEGAGKSTALQFIQHYFTSHAIDVVMTREPGGTPLAEEIRQLLLHPASRESMSAETELLLMFAGRAQHLHQCILPALQAGMWVVSDRYIDASYAYQGGGRGIDTKKISILDHFVVANHYPDLTLLLDVPADVGLSRMEARGLHKDRIESEQVDFFVRVRNTYLARANADPKRIKIIDASQTQRAVQEQIRSVLDLFCKEQRNA